MKKFKVLIVDDEQPAREELKYLLEDYDDVEVVGETDNGLDCLKRIEELKPDIVFLDINIPKISGCEVAKSISSLGELPYIVFITAYDVHAVEAFEIGAVDYLLKPLNSSRLYKTLEKIRNFYKNDNNQRESINTASEFQPKKLNKLAALKNGRIKLVDLSEIIFAKAYSGEVIIKTENDRLIYKGTIKSLENKLNNKFFRVQKSYIVNLDKIAEVVPWFKGTYWLIMDDAEKTQIPVSKAQIKELKLILGLDSDI